MEQPIAASAAGMRPIGDAMALASVLQPLITAGGGEILVRSPWAWRAGRLTGAMATAVSPAPLVCTPRLARQVLGQMGLAITGQRRSGLDWLLCARPSGAAAAPPLVYENCTVSGSQCRIDGQVHAIRRGNWAFFVPALGIKILHARDARRFCFHESRPDDRTLATGDGSLVLGPYTLADWRAALATPVVRRAAENVVSARRLAAIAAGPAVGRAIAIGALSYGDGGPATPSAGFEIADLTGYVRKPATLAEDLDRAGVTADRIRSALRQQIGGYVSDLDSVVGVMPVDADAEVRDVESRLNAALSAAGP